MQWLKAQELLNNANHIIKTHAKKVDDLQKENGQLKAALRSLGQGQTTLQPAQTIRLEKPQTVKANLIPVEVPRENSTEDDLFEDAEILDDEENPE